MYGEIIKRMLLLPLFNLGHLTSTALHFFYLGSNK
jgi:hypothetical protein